MNQLLAEKLLVKVMGWTNAEIASERPNLQALAEFKYDTYQQFAPGMHFVESLATWLNQFREQDRNAAYNFVRNYLIFIGQSEMSHLISTAFPDHIQPILLRRVTESLGLPPWAVAKAVNSMEYKILLRQTLFLGLSDGARIDAFRRHNPQLSNEQVWLTYEITEPKKRDLIEELKKGLANILGREPTKEESKFRKILLLDDFSASGISYFRKNSEGEFKGKLPKFLQALLRKDGDLAAAVDVSTLDVQVLLYIATNSAVANMRDLYKDWASYNTAPQGCAISAIQELSSKMSLTDNGDAATLDLLTNYFDSSIMDNHYKKGKHDRPYLGFNECGLPLVLTHNTPNNSVPLLWFEDNRLYRGLFPRVSRHKGEA